MNTYSTARAYTGFLQALGWIVVALGAIAAVAAFANATVVAALTVGLPPLIGGFALIALAQMMSAQIDTAANTAEIRDLLRRQIQGQAANTATTAAGSSAVAIGSTIKTYKGHAIIRDPSGVRVGSRVLPNVIAAERWIDGQ